MSRFEKVIVVAPTRSTCLNIALAVTAQSVPKTLLSKEKGEEIVAALASLEVAGKGFGIVAGTGAGKTLAIRTIAQTILHKKDLLIDVVTREHQASDYTWGCDVIIVTPGVSMNWLKGSVIKGNYLIVVDEIHQTSAHLELTLALAKRNQNAFIWMSATIDANIYGKYLHSDSVIHCAAYDPAKKSKVTVKSVDYEKFLEAKVPEFVAEQRGVVVFVPTRQIAEQLARKFSSQSSLVSEFYHGGEHTEKLRQFLRGEIARPFMVFMTSVGSSSLNIGNLDTVVIVDSTYRETVYHGVKVMEKAFLTNNEILQMAGRVNGRAINGEIYILSGRVLDFESIHPTVPVFDLSNDMARVAMTCAKLGVPLSDLELIADVDMELYNQSLYRLMGRGVIFSDALALTPFGENIEQLPVEPAWGELIAFARERHNYPLVNLVVVCSCVDSLYRLSGKDADFTMFGVESSDHLTAYNIVASSLQQFAHIERDRYTEEQRYVLLGDTYYQDRTFRQPKLVKGEFVEWCDMNGLKANPIRDVIVSMRSVYGQMGYKSLPKVEEFNSLEVEGTLHQEFLDLLAYVQSLEFVHDRENSAAGKVLLPAYSFTQGKRVLGRIRFWNNRRGARQASIEGTEIPEELIRKYARKELVDIGEETPEGIPIRFNLRFAGELLEGITEYVTAEQAMDYLAASTSE